ncbi:MAG: C4-type zinc ribbon domain-containing protein [Chloroflexi bacterium]|nr:C4-type zinc ribbon domain-containing protein [Chloroflexota bacterium]
MSVLSDLAVLQHIDSQRDELVAQARQLQRQITDESSLAERRQRYEQVHQSLRELQLTQARLEQEIAVERDQVERHLKLLNGPDLTRVQVYQAAEQELTHHQNRVRELEDTLLGLLEDVEVATQQTADLEQEIREREVRHAEQVKQWKRELQHVILVGREIEQERSARAAAIPPQALATYEQLRRHKNGRAVAPIAGSACGACRLTLPAGTLARVRRGGDFVYCDHCGRLLVGES